jgi:ankyrin repeat protein
MNPNGVKYQTHFAHRSRVCILRSAGLLERPSDRRLFMVRLSWLSASAFVALPLLAASSDDLCRAIREGNTAQLKTLMEAGGTATADTHGSTALHCAALLGSVDSVKLLLAAGAPANVQNTSGATPLLLAAPSAAKVKLLLAAGADPKLATKRGRTPLMIAAGSSGGIESAKLLLSAGAPVSAADDGGDTAFLEAAGNGDLETIRLLLEHGADAKAVDKSGDNAFTGRLSLGDIERVRLLISSGADVNIANVDGGSVRHGKIALTSMTPLLLAAPHSPLEVVEALLRAGAKVNVQDGRGFTPLMAAVTSERQNPKVVAALLAAGADPNARDGNGESVLDWARKFGNPQTLKLLEAAGAKGQPAPAAPQSSTPAASALEAVRRAMPLLQKSSTGFFNESGCVGCHHQPATARAEFAVQATGVPVSDAGRQEQQRDLAPLKALEPLLTQMLGPGGGTDTIGAILVGSAAAGVPPSALTDAAVNYLVARQDRSGAWLSYGLSRAPIEESQITRTALAVKSIKEYGWPARKPEFDACLAKARAWLLLQEPEAAYEQADRLLGLYWSGAGASELQRAGAGLKRRQKVEGGWSQNPYLAPDAFATGLALYALHETGQLHASDAAYARGVEFLRKTQFEDGSWYVRSRAPKFQPYFQSGFPYEHDQWISAMATAYAVMALAPAGDAQSTASTRIPRHR